MHVSSRLDACWIEETTDGLRMAVYGRSAGGVQAVYWRAAGFVCGALPAEH